MDIRVYEVFWLLLCMRCMCLAGMPQETIYTGVLGEDMDSKWEQRWSNTAQGTGEEERPSREAAGIGEE